MTSVQVEWPDAATAVLRLSRPDRLNALTHEMLDELTASLREAASIERARAVILTGAGRAFCAGVDIAGAADRGRSEPSAARRYVRQEPRSDRAAVVSATGIWSYRELVDRARSWRAGSTRSAWRQGRWCRS